MRASHASYWRRSSRSRSIAAALLDGPLGILLPLHLGAQSFESLDGPGGQRFRVPEPARRGDDPRRVLETLHPAPGLVERSPHRPGAGTVQEQRLVTVGLDVWDDAIEHIRRTRHT